MKCAIIFLTSLQTKPPEKFTCRFGKTFLAENHRIEINSVQTLLLNDNPLQ